jgi:hypothetical protein
VFRISAGERPIEPGLDARMQTGVLIEVVPG